MRYRTFIVIIAAVVILAIVAAVMARGPIGPESVACKESSELIANAGSQVEAFVEKQIDISPDHIVLPSALERKRQAKKILARAGFLFGAPESASTFLLRSKAGADTVRAITLCRGDHLIGVTVVRSDPQSNLAKRLSAALQSTFVGYQIQESSRTGI